MRLPATKHSFTKHSALKYTALLALPALLVGCAQAPEERASLDQAFADAARESDVPRDLLVALAYTQSRLDDRGGEMAEDGSVGVMGLQERQVEGGPSLAHGAELIGHDVGEVAMDPTLNILAAAQELRWQGDIWEQESGLQLQDVSDWAEIAGWYAGGENAGLQRGFAREVLGWIEDGLEVQTPSGEWIVIQAREVDAPWLAFQPIAGVAGDYYGNANFVQAHSSNYTNQSRGAGDIDMIVVHTAQGSYSGTANWFADSRANASAHYVIRSSDGEVTQMLFEEDRGWHAGHSYTNSRSVAIELEGYISMPSTYYTESMYSSLAALIVDIGQRQGVTLDRSHVIGHNEVPGCSGSGGGASCHTDPGSGFDWDKLMDKVAVLSGGGSSSGGSSSGGSSSAGSSSAGASSGGATGTGTLIGFVRDGSVYSGAGISGATVTTSAGQSATTDSSGLYKITGVAPGYLTVSVTASGYDAGMGEEEVQANHNNWESVALTASGGPSGIPTGISPTGWRTATGPSVTMDWDDISGASYEVKIYFYDGANWQYYYAYSTSDSTKTYWPAVDNTYYAWTVRAKGGSGSGEWSDNNYFYFKN